MAAVDSIPPPATGGFRLLLVEDEPEFSAILAALFIDEGYHVDVAGDGQRGLHLGLTRSFDVIVLDRGLPAIEGLDLMRQWRRHGVTTPVLILSARGTTVDRVAGLDAGAEDYLAKPFDVDELLARLRALRRRHLDVARMLPVGAYLLDLDTREVSAAPDQAGAGAEPVQLSERECGLLATLAGRPGQIFSRYSAALTCSPAYSPRLKARSWSTPTCTICGASSGEASWTPCAAAVTVSAGTRADDPGLPR
jgi:two-component system response regulator QseB